MEYERVRDLTAANPAQMFDLPRKGYIEPERDADLVLVDPEDSQEIDVGLLHSNCEWTMVRGTVVYEGGEFHTPVGQNVRG